MAELLPEGDLKKPAASLSVEWFYMTFHRSDRAEYFRSGCKLCKEMLKLLAEYFESIYDSRLSEGLVSRRQLEKIQANAKREMHHELWEQYGPTDHVACDATTDIVNANTVSVAKMSDTPMMRAVRRVSPRARTRVSSPATCMVSMLSIRTKSAAKTCTIGPTKCTKSNPTTTSTRVPTMRVTIIMTLATQAAAMSRAGVITLPCPVMERSPAQRATAAKPSRKTSILSA